MNEGIELEYLLEPRIAVSVEATSAPDIRAPFDEGAWSEAEPIGALVDRGRPERDAEHATDVRLCHTDRAVYVAFRCSDDAKVKSEDVQRGALGRKAEGVFDWIEILVDAEHRHMRALRLKLDANGHMQAWRIIKSRSELPGAVSTRETELAYGAGVHASVRVTDSGWEGAVEIPCAKLGIETAADGARVLGFDFERVAPAHKRHWRWAPGIAGTDNTPLEYGDLYLGTAGFTVTKFDFGRVLWEGSPLVVTLTPAGGAPKAKGELELSTKVVMPYDREELGARTVSAKASGSAVEMETVYELSHRGRWPVEAEYTQRLVIDLRQKKSGAVVYSGEYPFSVAGYMKPNEPYGLSEADRVADPERSDAEFIKNKRKYIANRLPRFIRRRTTDGAPSDFTLTAADGPHEFNLMEPGALAGMAEMVESLFETEEDRLVGACLLIHQRTVTRHAGAYTRLFPMSPLSILRAGGGICGVRSPALCGLISLMKSPRTGEPYFTRVIEIGGHTVTGVTDTEQQPDGDCVVLDADCGMVFYVPDNSRLATLDDLERDWSIPYRSNVNNLRYDHEMFSDPKFHHTHGWPYHGSWPEGAPEW